MNRYRYGIPMSRAPIALPRNEGMMDFQMYRPVEISGEPHMMAMLSIDMERNDSSVSRCREYGSTKKTHGI